MKRAILVISSVIALCVIGMLDYMRTPRTDSAAYASGLTDGESFGRIQAQHNAAKMDSKAIAAAPTSRLPWSVKLNFPHAIAEFSAGWAAGYEQGYHYRQPWKIASK